MTGATLSKVAAALTALALIACNKASEKAPQGGSPQSPRPTRASSPQPAPASADPTVRPALRSTLPLERIRLPPGFAINAYATGLDDARSLTRSGNTLFVGSRRAGRVYAVVDADGNGVGDRIVTIASGLNMPNGVAVHGGALFVAEVNRVLRFDAIAEHLDNPPKPVVVTDRFPTDRLHGWKFIAFGPDGALYVPVGAPCNVCESAAIYATITRMRPDGSGFEIFAHGVRNTVGFDWHPQTKELWFTDNGRDWLGDDQPPDELNRAPRPGMDFGFPYCHGKAVADPEFHKKSCKQTTPPVQELAPHAAALGMRFYTGTMFPPEYRGQIFIAEHGSWNRTKKIGYRISLVRLSDAAATSYEVFAEGWLQPGERVWGRPVDVLVAIDGALLVSDDEAGAIYRISYAR